ncbi:energy transducer TonB [Sphingomonas sp. 1P06PA]|uniref:energy transducer TonB n=1 Tax=Sphingomonas sp. 1P06PA TaxID=554121 RepID=UPI0039A4F6EB
MILPIAILLMAPSEAAGFTIPAESITPQAEWITSEDYPKLAIQQGQAGTTHVSYTIDPDGRVNRCEILGSSGSAVLDVTACELLKARGRYRPARDQRGNAVSSTTTRRVRWEIPQAANSDEQPFLPDRLSRPFSVSIQFTVGEDLKMKDCTVQAYSGLPGSASDVCPAMLAAGRSPMPIDPSIIGESLIFTVSLAKTGDTPAQKARR